MNDNRLCTYSECSISEICKRSAINTGPEVKNQSYLSEIEYDDEYKCTSFLPIHKTAEKLYRLATFPARVLKRVTLPVLGDNRRGSNAHTKRA